MTTSRADLHQGSDPAGHPARREPLLWLQLLGLAALPLEAVLLVLLLGGADPGPWPGLERVLVWALGGLGSAFLFWRLPPDLWSLLLLQVPLRGRRPDQLRLSALQQSLPLKLLTSAGAALSLPLLWWADRAAGLAWSWSPLAGSSRLIGLLAAALVLVLLQWQWHQLAQALWMLSRRAELVAATTPLSQAEAADRRLSLGLPLLLVAPLRFDPQPQPAASPARTTTAGVSAPVEAVAEAATFKGQVPDLGSEPPTLSEPGEPTAPSKPDELPESGETVEFRESGATVEPGQPIEPSDSTVPAEPAEAKQPMEPTGTAELDDSPEPHEHSEPREPDPAPEPASAPEAAVASAPIAAAPADLPIEEPSLIEGTAAILPEQQAEQAERTDLDQQV